MLNSLKYKVSTFKNIKDFKHKTRQSFYQKIGFMKFFDLHEYQSKIILRQHGLRVQNGDLATSHTQAKEIADRLKGELIIKAQVHAGGRGKGHLTSGLKGGVKICQTSNEIENFANQMIGYNLITKQTSKEGLPVSSVLVLESVDIKRQLYLAILLDRAHSGPVIIYSTEGGMEIEEVAEKNPEAIHFEPVDVKTGLTHEQAEKIVSKLGFETVEQKQDAVDQLKKLYTLFNKVDATQVEINPWAVDTNGKVNLSSY
jgi:succinyl-CoA synthetase beta subunit